MKGVGAGSPLIKSYMGVGQELTNRLKGVGHVFSFMLKQKNPPPPTYINNDRSLSSTKVQQILGPNLLPRVLSSVELKAFAH